MGPDLQSNGQVLVTASQGPGCQVVAKAAFLTLLRAVPNWWGGVSVQCWGSPRRA